MTKIEFLGAKVETDTVLTVEEIERMLINVTSAYTTAVIAMNTSATVVKDPDIKTTLN